MNVKNYSSITNDSRKVEKGSLFIAVTGCGNDGRQYINEAIAKGAAGVVYEAIPETGRQNDTGLPRPTTHNDEHLVEDCHATLRFARNDECKPYNDEHLVKDCDECKPYNDDSLYHSELSLSSLRGSETTEAIPDQEVEFFPVSNSQIALAQIADEYYDHPSGKLNLIGITGTNGKTTTVTLLYNLFRRLGYECGLLSTIANYVGPRKIETLNTTSDPLTINRLLSEMVEAGCQYCFMEVSSIGVDQHRVDCLEFKMGIFSNLTHDHLDYHKTFAEYLRCKQVFFDKLPKTAIALTNIDDRNGKIVTQNSKAQVLSYSCRSLADHHCKIIEKCVEGTLLNIDGTELWTRLIGTHNAYNLLAVYSAAVELGAKSEEVILGLSALEAPSGRLEAIHGPRNISVVIDYAHTPDALENVLVTLKDICQGELVCLFGCGGDRDKTKRPEMAEIAQKYADRIILSEDNSRHEKTEDIIKDIKEGLDNQGLIKTISIIDREEAIRTAILYAKPGSTILLAGKGHEKYQIVGKEKLHFDEHEIVNAVFETLR